MEAKAAKAPTPSLSQMRDAPISTAINKTKGKTYAHNVARKPKLS